ARQGHRGENNAMVRWEHQPFGAGKLRWLDHEAVLATLDPDAERAQRRDGGGNSICILILEFLRIADHGPAVSPGGERCEHWKLVDHALDQCSSTDFDAAQRVTG